MTRTNAYLIFACIFLGAAPSASASFFSSNKDQCEMYLAPSHLKNTASHGFGLGIFTGKLIHQGEILSGLREILIPLYDSSTLDKTHPPLREYVWPAVGCVPELAIHTNDRQKAFWFGGGISSMAPCTSKGFNVKIWAGGNYAGAPRWNVLEDLDGVPLRNDPHAGSYSYRHGMTYIAARDIHPGEEIVVDCSDDNFDHLSLLSRQRRNSYKANDDSYMCLDNVHVGESQVANAGKGLVAAKSLSKDDVILSSPVVPIHRRDLIGDGTGNTAKAGINNNQLMLNYAFGDEESDLLLLPYGPFVNYINGSGGSARQKANAVLKWHKTGEKEAEAPRRMQFHHHELFSEYAKVVLDTHGKGLVIDIVALDEIGVGEEIFLDYGKAWGEAYETHSKRWDESTSVTYHTADQWFNNKKLNPNPEYLQTVEELNANPYPDNLQTICYYDSDVKVERVDEASNTTYAIWDDANDDTPPHECMRPCEILERYADPDEEGEFLYTAEMFHFEGEENYWFCDIRAGRHIARNVDFDGILIVDKPYSHDIFLEKAFRHAIGVPDDFYPKEWLRPKVRRRTEQEPTRSLVGDEFRRKKTDIVISRKAPKEEL